MRVCMCGYECSDFTDSSGIVCQGVGVFESKEKIFRSGIVHHMVIVKKVLEDMFTTAERLHGGMPFWKVDQHIYLCFLYTVCMYVCMYKFQIYCLL